MNSPAPNALGAASRESTKEPPTFWGQLAVGLAHSDRGGGGVGLVQDWPLVPSRETQGLDLYLTFCEVGGVRYIGAYEDAQGSTA